MCGIAGYFGNFVDDAKDFIEKANVLLTHRGPDGHGFYTDENVSFCHRRLAIQDLSDAGKQPMISDDGRYVLIFNGEIYNHLELRSKYYSKHRFTGHSDTATLLQLLIDFKHNCLQELVGMWAFAFWDKLERKLLLSRDRYGQKPLFWKREDKGFYFASEIKPLLKQQGNQLNHTAAVEYLALGNYGHLGSKTFFKNVYQLLPSTYAYVDLDKHILQQINYWKLEPKSEKEKIEFDASHHAEIKQIIEEAVRSQLLADVKIGATLSGGIDSSIVVGMLANLSKEKRIPVFTAQTHGSKWDESVYVRDVETMWGTDRLEVIWKEMSLTKISEQLASTIHVQEEPFGDPSIIAHKQLIKMAKENGVKVLLGGQGADEIFLGYPSTSKALMAVLLREGYFSDFFINIRSKKPSYAELMRMVLASVSPQVERSLRLRSRKSRRSWINKDFLKEVVEQDINLSGHTDVYAIWNDSINGTYLPHLVHYDDRNTMHESIEGRMPFLDHRILDRLNDFKASSFYRQGVYKTILRESCKDYLPKSILKRKDKIGFYTPLKEMINNERDWIVDVLNNQNPAFSLDPTMLQMIKTNNLDYNSMLIVWRAVSFQIWLQNFNVS